MLWQDVGLTRPWNDAHADLRRAVAGPASEVLAAVRAGELVATAMVGHDGHRGWIYYLAVRPDARRRGYGRRMMQACEEWLTNRGIPKVNLMVRGDNALAHDFYAAIGYHRDEVAVLSRRLSLVPEGAQSE
jgi:ribosomal protein S18 acetylase RimI-like enzyme